MGFYSTNTYGMDQILGGRQTIRGVAGIPEREFVCGDRVAFVRTLSALLTYENSPEPSERGTVIRVRTASGTSTEFENRIFVKWDSGQTLPVLRDHIIACEREKVAGSFSRRVNSLGDLGDFFKVASGDELVHKATRDLWSLSKASDGGYVIERLFDNSGEPLKV